jgi:hypothetical protein
MIEQELTEHQEAESSYKSKISKYKLLVTKLNENQCNALSVCANSDMRKLIENIPTN